MHIGGNVVYYINLLSLETYMSRYDALHTYQMIKEAATGSGDIFSSGEGETTADMLFTPPALRARNIGYRRARREFDFKDGDRARIIKEHGVPGMGQQIASNLGYQAAGFGSGALLGGLAGGGRATSAAGGALLGMLGGGLYGHSKNMRNTQDAMYRASKDYAAARGYKRKTRRD
jgi:hypothetical protein